MVTIRDVAQASGVHVSTVSRTFSAPHLVSAETRNRVLAVAEGLGYRPNRAARALTTGRTHNLGLIVADIANPFFPPLIKAAQAQARERDYHVFVADTDENPLMEQELIETLCKQVDGVLLCSPRLSNRVIERLRAQVPFAVVNRRVKGLPTVLMDVGQGVRAAVEHLADLGHRRIALLSGPSGSWTSEEMHATATDAAAEAGVELTVLRPNEPTEQGGLAAAAAVAGSGMTGVLCHNDLVALGLIEGLRERGLSVPGDLSVIGVDDSLPGRLNRPKLTTITMPTAAAGRMAVDLLLAAVNAGDAATAALARLETTLIVRESTGPAAPSALPARLPASPAVR
ncbi:LacI family transcriptional regulator [Planomonospora parontospora subsp. parontospora]|uniref:LacI family transcriptional regulator n=2 Tax=Planomonospora parontospora TaxID=58119 RepID=A0AA37BE16_9ACTN|nr:LacI family DNA-binding transcriptional regulator [Planomonospora parontospora]GGK54383.1 LacI family transcriptional regulator [Planomonospora parontospora]GII07518.1 LacI family transcriptional regulator [Planomonospora parontospora subsp. parontospora]